MSAAQRFIRGERTRFRAVDDEGVIVQMDTGHVIVVNETALQLVAWLDSPLGISELAERLAQDYAVSPTAASADVTRCVEELQTLGVIVQVQD